jgi:dolichol-phosphate mannosyltransferase
MLLSVVIPAHNEEGSVAETVRSIHAALVEARIDHEILVVNDHSTDTTGAVLDAMGTEVSTLRHLINSGPGGFGYAVRWGLERVNGDRVAVMMADSPADLVRFNRKMDEGFDCVFGSRWGQGGEVIDYPPLKRRMNRVFNTIVRMLFRLRYDDCTNAFKLYSRPTLEGLKPFLSPHFNLTLELPLKAIVRGYSYAVVPNSWRNRKSGVSKLKIKEMGSRYFFIMLYCLIEKYFAQGDFPHPACAERYRIGPRWLAHLGWYWCG